jgi:hypothetical protein
MHTIIGGFTVRIGEAKPSKIFPEGFTKTNGYEFKLQQQHSITATVHAS